MLRHPLSPAPIGTVLVLSAAFAACRPGQVQYASSPEVPPESSAPEAILFLLGDGGEASEGRDAVLGHLGDRLEAITAESGGARVAAVFLGDNIYEVGAREGFEDQDLAKLTAQVEPLGMSPDVSAFFLPGNHDWAKGASTPEGRTALRLQRDWLTRIAEGHDVRLIPGDACPGPEAVDLGETIHLLFIDTEWLLRGLEDDCGSPDDFYENLRQDLEANRDKRVILLSHHPMVSGGPHGGNVALFERGPFLYYLAAKAGVSVQDIASGAYATMVAELRAAFEASGNRPLLHAAGHDHNLQVIRNQRPDDPRYQLVSGSASRSNNAERVEGTRYATNGYGYMQLDFHPDHVRLVVYARELTSGPVRAVYACSIGNVARAGECPEAALQGPSR